MQLSKMRYLDSWLTNWRLSLETRLNIIQSKHTLHIKLCKLCVLTARGYVNLL